MSRNCSEYKPLKCKPVNLIRWVTRTDSDHLIQEHCRRPGGIRSICLPRAQKVLECELLNVVHAGQDVFVIATYKVVHQHRVLLTASSDKCLLAMRVSLSSMPNVIPTDVKRVKQLISLSNIGSHLVLLGPRSCVSN